MLIPFYFLTNTDLLCKQNFTHCKQCAGHSDINDLLFLSSHCVELTDEVEWDLLKKTMVISAKNIDY